MAKESVHCFAQKTCKRRGCQNDTASKIQHQEPLSERIKASSKVLVSKFGFNLSQVSLPVLAQDARQQIRRRIESTGHLTWIIER
jgi:hypothetical protein